MLERRATPADVERAFAALRGAGFDNLSLDLIYGIPGQTPEELAADLAHAIALGPEHISAYELEAKPGTRFTIAYGAELERQAERMEDYFERVVATLTGAGYRWYETANFCRDDRRSGAEHNLGYWLGRDYLGLGVGAVSTLGDERRRNTPKLARYLARRATTTARSSCSTTRRGARARDARPPARRAAAARRARARRSTPTVSRAPSGSVSRSTPARRSRSPGAAASSAAA